MLRAVFLIVILTFLSGCNIVSETYTQSGFFKIANNTVFLNSISNQLVMFNTHITAIDANTSTGDFDLTGEVITYSCYYDTAANGSVLDSLLCSSLPGATFDSHSGILTWLASGAGVYEFKIVAKTSKGSDKKYFSIEVLTSNLAPELNVIENQTIGEGTPLATIDANDIHTGADVDRDGNVITYSCTANGSNCGSLMGMTFSSVTGQLDWTPNYTQSGVYNVMITGSDTLLFANASFTITVTNTNRAPVLDAISDQTVAEGVAITTINANDSGDDLDVDNDALTYSCDIDGSDCSTLTGFNFDLITGEATWTPNYAQAGTYNFTVTGSDGSLTDDETFTITVTGTNLPPELSMIGDQTIAEGSAIATVDSFDVHTTNDTDRDGETISYSCYYDTTVDGAVAEVTDCSVIGASFSTMTGILNWTPNFTQAGTYEFKITGTDPGLLSDAKIFTIVVNPAAPFISVWRTTAATETITLPLRNGFNYDFTVDWGDGSPMSTITTWNDPDITHSYAVAGDYTVTIKGLVEAWYFANAGDKWKIISVSQLGEIGIKDMSQAFSGCDYLENFTAGQTDTSQVTNMSSTFENAKNLTTIDLSSFNTTNVTTMYSMFNHAEKLTAIDLSSFNTANVTSMSQMFFWTTNAVSIGLYNFNTVNVTNMNRMFLSASSLVTLDLSHFDTAKVTDMGNMFRQMTSLTSINISNFNTDRVTDMSAMFALNSNLTSLDLTNFNTSNVTRMDEMFLQSSKISALDLSGFDTSKVYNMNRMFKDTTLLSTLNLTYWDIDPLPTSSDIFTGFTGTLYCNQGGSPGTGSMFGVNCN